MGIGGAADRAGRLVLPALSRFADDFMMASSGPRMTTPMTAECRRFDAQDALDDDRGAGLVDLVTRLAFVWPGRPWGYLFSEANSGAVGCCRRRSNRLI